MLLFLQSQSIAQKERIKHKLKNVTSYYKYVYSAEIAIIHLNFAKASKKYKKAFLHKQPFERDLNNAIFSEIYGKCDSTIIIHWIKQKIFLNPDNTYIFKIIKY